jgi:hypothetical protein
VEAGKEQAACPGFRRHEAQRRHGKEVYGLKPVQKTTLGPVGEDLIVNVSKYLGLQDFDLETGLVAHAMSTRQAGCLFLAESTVQETTLFGQGLIACSCYLGQEDVAVLPADHMSGTCDLHCKCKAVVVNFARGYNVEELGMHGPPVQLKYQLADARSEELDAHEKPQTDYSQRGNRLNVSCAEKI